MIEPLGQHSSAARIYLRETPDSVHLVTGRPSVSYTSALRHLHHVIPTKFDRACVTLVGCVGATCSVRAGPRVSRAQSLH